MKPLGMQNLAKPLDPFKEENVVAEGFLHRIVDDSHQRNDGVECYKNDNGQYEQPALLICDFIHLARLLPATPPDRAEFGWYQKQHGLFQME